MAADGSPSGRPDSGRPDSEHPASEHPDSERPDRAEDRIELRGLRCLGAHGVLPEEHGRAQPFEVDLDIATDLHRAGSSDDLGDTIDYGAVTAAVAAVIGGVHADLLEHLAERVATTVFDVAGPRAQALTVTVRKLRPPVPFDLASSAVTIVRRRRA